MVLSRGTMNNSNSSLPFLISDTSGSVTLDDLNSIKRLRYVPAMVYTGVLIVVGGVGNSLVVGIFTTKVKTSNYKCFVLVLAFFDLVACSVAMPGIVVDLFLPYKFMSAALCKILRFGYFYIACGSALTHLLLAVERHRKVCYPLGRQLSQTKAKLLLGIVVFVVSPMASAPCVVIFGHSTTETGVRNVTGVACYLMDHVKNTAYPTVYISSLLFGMVLIITVMSICYLFIARKLWERHKILTKLRPFRASSETSISTNTIQWRHRWKRFVSHVRVAPQNSNQSCRTINVVSLQKTDSTEFNIQSRHRHKSFADYAKKRRKVTVISLTITVIFIVSFCPYLTLTLSAYVDEDFVSSMSSVEEGFYMVGTHLFMIHNVANPIVYLIMDKEFRHNSRAVFRRRNI